MSILENINYPSDIKSLDIAELEQLCDELRSFIIADLSENPGHLGSSLGVIELTVALHYIYDTPNDRLVWDVGHQAYAHKVLTGRKEQFHTKRKLGGISGFPKRDESPYDSFGGGHSSVSISAVLGMAEAAKILGEQRHSIAVIGDGAMGGGLAFEGVNNAGASKSDLLVILNDNDMSIDPNVGALNKYLLSITTSRKYNYFRGAIYRLFTPFPKFRATLGKMLSSFKRYVFQNSNLFESFGFRYFGTVDGHDLKSLIEIIQRIKSIKGPKLLHIITVKGKGFAPAEVNQTKWHAPGRFDVESGKIAVKDVEFTRFQDVFGHTLSELGEKNSRIVGVTPAMPSGCSMNIFQRKFPERTFDVGIAEGHAVTFSGGLAAGGLLPFCNIYSSFMQRAYDNVVHDLVLQGVDVVLCLDRAGLVGEDGATHHGVLDISIFRAIPNVIIAAPSNEHELRNMMYSAQLKSQGVYIIRYPRGSGKIKEWRNQFVEIETGKGVVLKEGGDVAILALGSCVEDALWAANSSSRSVFVADMKFAKPIDETIVDSCMERFSVIVTVEDGVIEGGFGAAVAERVTASGLPIKVVRLGVPDKFIGHGSVSQLKSIAGYDKESILKVIEDLCDK